MTITGKTSAGNVMMTLGVGSSATVGGMSWLDHMDAHAAAYGLILSAIGIAVGAAIQIWRVRSEIKHREKDKNHSSGS